MWNIYENAPSSGQSEKYTPPKWNIYIYMSVQIIVTTNYGDAFILWTFFVGGGTKKNIGLLGISFKK